MSPIQNIASLNYASENLRIVEAITEEMRELDDTLKQTRRRDLEHNGNLIREAQASALKKAAIRYQPTLRFSKVNAGKVAPSTSFGDDAPARSLDPLAAQIHAAQLAASRV